MVPFKTRFLASTLEVWYKIALVLKPSHSCKSKVPYCSIKCTLPPSLLPPPSSSPWIRVLLQVHACLVRTLSGFQCKLFTAGYSLVRIVHAWQSSTVRMTRYLVPMFVFFLFKAHCSQTFYLVRVCVAVSSSFSLQMITTRCCSPRKRWVRSVKGSAYVSTLQQVHFLH